MLKAWYPFNGDSHNYGLEQLNETISGNPVWVDGKIGKSLSASSNTSEIILTAEQTAKIFNNEKISIAFWIYPDADEGTALGNNGIFGNTPMIENNNRKFSIFLHPTCNDLHWAWMNDAQSVTYTSGRISGCIPSREWTHICFTYDNPNGKIYINGQLVKTFTGISNSSSFAYETRLATMTNQRRMNDLRVYDNVLSPKEVKEISKGLILHFPLSMSGENLIQTNSLAPTSGTSGWSKAGTGWTLSNVTADGTMNGHAIRCTFSGTTGVQGGIHHPTGINKEDMENGQIYTLQARVRASKACTAKFFNELFTTTTNLIDLTTEWKIYSCSCEINNEKTSYSNVVYVVANTVTNGMWIECEWVKLEIGDKATPWIPSKNDSKYSSLGFDSNIVYDVSGYKNNGTINGTLTHNTNTPRFNTCTVFQNKSHIINNTKQIRLDNEFTISFWYKVNTWEKDWEGAFLLQNTTALNSANGTYSVGSAVHASNSNAMTLTIRQGGDKYVFDQYKWTYEIGQWNHYACTYNKGVIIMYQNGEQVHSGTISDSCANNYYYTVGRRVTTKGDCCMSDFRVYNTVLSSDDILGLYNTPTSLSRNGVLLTTEYVEGI